MKIINYIFYLFFLICFSCAPSAFKNSNQGVVHKSSQVQFPKKVGSFERTKYQAYDEKGNDVGVGYQIREADCVVTISFFIYPKYGRTLQEEFTAVNDAIEQYNDGARLLKVKTVSEHPFEDKEGLFSEYEVQNGHSITYFFERDDDFYKYRITYPSSTKKKSEEEIEFFLNNFKW